MSDYCLLPADQVAVADRAALLNAAYVGYYVPMHLTTDALRAVDYCYDVDLKRSVVARGDAELAGMALLACRGERGWVSGVGVLPAWRRQGIGRALMTALLAHAQERGLRQITLEMIAQNAPAQALYTTLGFVAGRELLTWRFSADADALPIPAELLTPAPVAALLAHYDGWHDQPACWQGEAVTLQKMVERLRGYRLDVDGAPAGYCLVSERDGAIALMDIGLAPGPGMVMAGRILLQALAARYRGRALSISNVPVDSGLNRVLAALHFLVTVRQYEMHLTFTEQ